ncbi:unnamed protein product [Paramecium pentaurelia]|uniref:BZIP domain-containing protein n=1 Tax=Paramecium pentaurelia TaxID=43138 RepID=A0A8S1RV02_9CILI|nr:unnamed protein product [Paramecium pentaurelia]
MQKLNEYQEYHLPEQFDEDQGRGRFLMPSFLPYSLSKQDVKLEERSMVQIDSQASIKDDALGLQNIKGHVKNTYIKKIHSLLSVEGENEKIVKKIQKEPSSSSKQLENEDQKMIRNRESARNSRQRKKLYINLLEKKVEDLNQAIGQLRNSTESTFQTIHSVLEQNSSIHDMIVEQTQLFEQLKIKEQEFNELQQLLTESYKLKYKATGIKRKQYIKYCFQNIARLLLDGNYGTLLFGQSYFSKNYTMHDEEELTDYMKNLRDATGICDDKVFLNLYAIVRRVIDHKKNFSFLIKQIKLKQKELRICQQQIDDQIDDIQLNGIQFANLIHQVNKDQLNQPQLTQPIEIPPQKQMILKMIPKYPFELMNNPFLLPNSLMIDPLQIDLITKNLRQP